MHVNFFIVGAAKSGTTSLANYLSQHPNIFIPLIKEPKYFSFDENTFPHHGPGDEIVDANVVKSKSDYESLYADYDEKVCMGDASVDYLFFDGVAERIKEYNPAAKIIIVLRNPVERAYSAYMHLVRDGREKLSFEDALEKEQERAAQNWEFFWQYREVGMYSSQVKRYYSVFPENQIMVTLFDDFVNDAQGFVNNVASFLEIDSDWEVDTSKRLNESGIPENRILHNIMNKKNYAKSLLKWLIPAATRSILKDKITSRNLKKKSMPDSAREKLLHYYANDVLELEKILKIELSHHWYIE